MSLTDKERELMEEEREEFCKTRAKQATQALLK